MDGRQRDAAGAIAATPEQHNGFLLKQPLRWAWERFLHELDLMNFGPIGPIQTALYEESCCRLRVLVIADFSDAEYERCTLLVMENLTLVATPCAPEVGSQFVYQRRRDVHCHGMARLVRDGPA